MLLLLSPRTPPTTCVCWGLQYSDFNTFYYGAASNTSAGSSGSPVINLAGEAIALNAGGQESTASSYYLPLDRIVRALKYIQRREAVPRGCVQAMFSHEAFNELVRLGLDEATEERVRKEKPEETGMLLANKVRWSSWRNASVLAAPRIGFISTLCV